MSETGYRNAAVIGTGMMGPGIAVALALGGLRATILSRSEEGAAAGLLKAAAQINLLESNGLASAYAAKWARANLSAGTAFEDTVAAADIVIESAPENMEFKQDLFARLDAIAQPETVLASNTSGLSITAVATRATHPERILTTHFWNPPHLMPLVEVVRGARTSVNIAEDVRDLLRRCGKTAVVVNKDTPGQLSNRLQHALIREAVHIVQEGIASVEDVDLAAKSGFGLRLPVYGIFEHQDACGLDMTIPILDYVAKDLCNTHGAPEYALRLLAEGNLGAKTGRGFYDWSKKDVEAVKALRDRFVLEFLKNWRNSQ